MIKVTETPGKTTAAKKNIQISDVKVSELRLVDETGDITAQVIEALPAGTETVSFKITVEVPDYAE